MDNSKLFAVAVVKAENRLDKLARTLVAQDAQTLQTQIVEWVKSSYGAQSEFFSEHLPAIQAYAQMKTLALLRIR